VTVTDVEADVPTVHIPVVVMVIGMETVHVSPGVVNVVGAPEPSVQFDKLLIAPAVPVVQAVEKPLKLHKQKIKTMQKVLRIAVLHV
jgi:hypothetical protein